MAAVDNLKKLSASLKEANAAKKGKGIIDIEDIKSKFKSDSPSIIDLVKRDVSGLNVKQPSWAKGPAVPDQATKEDVVTVKKQVEAKAAPKAVKPKASGYKKLKDTSGDYWSPSGDEGDYGSATGETGANMGQVNKGGYDASEGMKRGGKVKKMASGGSVKRSSASSRADGIATRGKTRGKIC